MTWFTLHNIIYLIGNIFRVYVFYKFNRIFFNRLKTLKWVEFLSYMLFYGINSFLHLTFLSPPLNICTNLSMFFYLLFLYEGKASSKLIATVLPFAINMLIESIVIWIVQEIPWNLDVLATTSVVSNLIFFTVILVLERVFAPKHHYQVKGLQWFSVFFIPVCSVFLALTFQLSGTHWIFTVLSTVCLLAINILVFYLYDFLADYYVEKYEKDLLQQQNKAFMNQLKIIRSSEENIRMFRHDIRNHVFRVHDMIQKEQCKEVLEYLEQAMEYTKGSMEYVQSGNDSVDSILNYKINEAKKLGAKVEANISIPNKLWISPFYLNVILGNLMDNAIRAIKDSEKKLISIEMELERGTLYIQMKNTHSGEFIDRNGSFNTTKQNKKDHGLGLKNVKHTVDKYRGTLNIEYDKEIFEVHILLYNIENDK